jgi:histone deacetylase 1/2
VLSNSGLKYYLIIVDDFSHFMWTFPLRRKSDTADTILAFISYIRTQFSRPLVAMQADNGTEFINSTITSYFTKHGIRLRLYCPYTSAQNGKAEHAIRTVNDVTRTLLFQSSMPPSYWAEAVAAATYLVNVWPSQPIEFTIPYYRLYNTYPDYSALRVFGCLCYPNQSDVASHKLAPRSTACVLLGYPSNHKGYRCLDIQTRRVILSRHVTFDESIFPVTTLPDRSADTASSLDFLLDLAAS